MEVRVGTVTVRVAVPVTVAPVTEAVKVAEPAATPVERPLVTFAVAAFEDVQVAVAVTSDLVLLV